MEVTGVQVGVSCKHIRILALCCLEGELLFFKVPGFGFRREGRLEFRAKQGTALLSVGAAIDHQIRAQIVTARSESGMG